MYAARPQQSGFTLVEMIIVMVITGIIGGVVAIFIQSPVQGYISSAHRAELTDIADTALRRMARDIRTAVPNSVRIPTCNPSNGCVEFIPTKDGGRYRAAGTGNVLSFGASGSNKFDVIGNATSTPVSIAAGDFIVVGSTQSDGSLPYSEAFNNGVLRVFTTASINAGIQTINFSGNPFWTNAALTSQRFDVVDGTQQAVTYACETDPNAVAGDGPYRLMRHWLYWTGATSPFAPYSSSSNSSSAILATKVSACVMGYLTPNQRFGLVTVLLTLNSSGESVTLYNEIHVNNSP